MVLLTDLLAVSAFGLRSLVAPSGPVSLSWAHGSDLNDPTPFTEPGQLLLTTGRQFEDHDSPARYDDYVRRLVDARVAAVGFGTEVIRHGTPAELAAACAAHGLPLIEIPYDTPFIAISRWVADQQAAAARSRLDWAVNAQSAISTAAIGSGGLATAITRAATLLHAAIVVLDPDLELVASHPPAEAGGADAAPIVPLDQVGKLLRAGRRAAIQLDVDDGIVLVRTLGRNDQLRGAIAVQRARPFDDAELSAITTLTALAEVSLEHGQDIRESVRALLRELFGLLQDGRVDIVRKAISGLPAGLPDQRFVVLAADTADLPDGLADTLERQASNPAHGTFHVTLGDRVLLLVDERRWPAVRELIRRARARAGASEPSSWEDLSGGLIQATRSLDAAAASQLLPFSDLVASSLLGLLAAPAAADIARARIAAVADRDDTSQLLAEAAVWLRHNAQWDPAARELGIHRHSLKAHMRRVGDTLGLDLQRFPARAELWTLLAALGLTDGG